MSELNRHGGQGLTSGRDRVKDNFSILPSQQLVHSSVLILPSCAQHTLRLLYTLDPMTTFDNRRHNNEWHGNTQAMLNSSRMIIMKEKRLWLLQVEE